ncbi:glycerol-3-phosphate acyltransferase ATS12, chloroplastic isoform X2 [Cornus florida]|uniref:glycerol-3-phosphate acyltransferase ATS12, chloroplastic isoform X2 n=1 Tax=Cornus florida TaxID=4283 RepID=UPI0028969493|nr:glycerol-3-phosphate acyltransferase ATS12, chloroplastic isoform X2 [Cornus florida]
MFILSASPCGLFTTRARVSSPLPYSKLSPISCSLPVRSRGRRCECAVFCSSKSRGMAEMVEDKESTVAVFASSSASEKSELYHSRTFLDASTEEDLLYGIRKETETGRLPSNVAQGMEELYQNYRNAVFQSGNPKADKIVMSNMTAVLDRVFKDVEDPFVFSPYHKALREPYDYFMFGQNYIRPLVDFRSSYVGNISLFNEIEEKLQKGHNVVLISNHQSEADPAIIALLLEETCPHITENLIYVAGDRVLTDPLCKPFSMGRGGSQIIWIAPSGGRDRPDPITKEWYPAPFDASSVDNMRRLAEHSGVPGHIYPLAILCYDIMPPPPQVEKEIGEKRVISFHGAGLSVAPEINFLEITAACGDPEEAKVAYTKALYDSVKEQYGVLNSAIHGKQGLEASIPTVSLSQPWN